MSDDGAERKFSGKHIGVNALCSSNAIVVSRYAGPVCRRRHIGSSRLAQVVKKRCRQKNFLKKFFPRTITPQNEVYCMDDGESSALMGAIPAIPVRGEAAYPPRISGSDGANSAYNKLCISKKVHFGHMDPRVRVPPKMRYIAWMTVKALHSWGRFLLSRYAGRPRTRPAYRALTGQTAPSTNCASQVSRCERDGMASRMGCKEKESVGCSTVFAWCMEESNLTRGKNGSPSCCLRAYLTLRKWIVAPHTQSVRRS